MSAAATMPQERKERLLQQARDVMVERAIRQWEQSPEYREWFRTAALERIKKISK